MLSRHADNRHLIECPMLLIMGPLVSTAPLHMPHETAWKVSSCASSFACLSALSFPAAAAPLLFLVFVRCALQLTTALAWPFSPMSWKSQKLRPDTLARGRGAEVHHVSSQEQRLVKRPKLCPEDSSLRSQQIWTWSRVPTRELRSCQGLAALPPTDLTSLVLHTYTAVKHRCTACQQNCCLIHLVYPHMIPASVCAS